ncbi:MAG: succinate dehydrogenase hydrophobic membrane anchor subunit [Actinomycetota bacterium]
MAVSTEIRIPETAPRRRPRSGAELWWWVFMRVSGILLLWLAVGHVLIMHVLGTGVERVNYNFVAIRWASPFWRIWDWLLLSLALLHGVNGVRVIVQDYVRSPRGRSVWNATFAVVGSALFILGTIIVLTFDAAGA